MSAKSIEETGVSHGGMVKCVAELPTANNGRFTPGKTYRAFQEGFSMKAHGNLKGPRDVGGKVVWDLPMSWAGYGYTWERASPKPPPYSAALSPA